MYTTSMSKHNMYACFLGSLCGGNSLYVKFDLGDKSSKYWKWHCIILGHPVLAKFINSN